MYAYERPDSYSAPRIAGPFAHQQLVERLWPGHDAATTSAADSDSDSDWWPFRPSLESLTSPTHHDQLDAFLADPDNAPPLDNETIILERLATLESQSDASRVLIGALQAEVLRLEQQLALALEKPAAPEPPSPPPPGPCASCTALELRLAALELKLEAKLEAVRTPMTSARFSVDQSSLTVLDSPGSPRFPSRRRANSINNTRAPVPALKWRATTAAAAAAAAGAGGILSPSMPHPAVSLHHRRALAGATAAALRISLPEDTVLESPESDDQQQQQQHQHPVGQRFYPGEGGGGLRRGSGSAATRFGPLKRHVSAISTPDTVFDGRMSQVVSFGLVADHAALSTPQHEWLHEQRMMLTGDQGYSLPRIQELESPETSAAAEGDDGNLSGTAALAHPVVVRFYGKNSISSTSGTGISNPPASTASAGQVANKRAVSPTPAAAAAAAAAASSPSRRP
ncbi:hypothetical protein BC828DRAFT_399041 [Blastocladiella britannica]|nr:hypothetical protein BC828DRAFT_399041 [Blastocladiella britannica]